MSSRAAKARDIMLKEGAVTTKLLQEKYNLDHPPRAIRDLKDAGALVDSEFVRDGEKSIKRYWLLDLVSSDGGAPRNPIKKVDKTRIIKAFDSCCAICGVRSDRLQLDHRIPFAIGGDPEHWTKATGMPLCASDNRAKSWACEHCDNWTTKDAEVCLTCMWCSPEDYKHIAGDPQRRLVITAEKVEDIAVLEKIECEASELEKSATEITLEHLRKSMNL